MSWTVIIEDEKGIAKRTMPDGFVLSDEEVLNNPGFKLIKYLDPYGNTCFNAFMLEDLVEDLQKLKTLLPPDTEKIDAVIEYAKETNEGPHYYLKFYGD